MDRLLTLRCAGVPGKRQRGLSLSVRYGILEDMQAALL